MIGCGDTPLSLGSPGYILHNPIRTYCQFTVMRSEKRVDLTVAPKQQPCVVQVMEGVGLVASGFQFLLGLAAVFAEEVGDFGVFGFISGVKRCQSLFWT